MFVKKAPVVQFSLNLRKLMSIDIDKTSATDSQMSSLYFIESTYSNVSILVLPYSTAYWCSPWPRPLCWRPQPWGAVRTVRPATTTAWSCSAVPTESPTPIAVTSTVSTGLRSARQPPTVNRRHHQVWRNSKMPSIPENLL